MCGIAGAASSRRGPEDLDFLVRKMTGALARRGPDDQGLEAWSDQSTRAVLGQRRLAILDLSPGGHQPMLSDDGRIGIVFNGCIYNFLELRKELEGAGHRFRSQCDTEVLLRGYQQWGVDAMLPKLRGMFAFAVWDAGKRRLWLVRDRLGVKPLYVAVEPDGVAFASTQVALSSAGIGQGADPQAVLEVLNYGFVSEHRSIRQGIRKVRAGTVLEWHEGAISERTYWTVPEVNPTSSIRFEEAVEHTEHLLLEATRLRLCADVPLGVLLSAGIDSTLVCWALTKLNANVSSFTVGTPGDPADESEEAKKTAERLGIPHRVVPLPTDGLPELDALIDAYGEPFAASSALGVLNVSRAVKPFATVLLTGDGGDDVFLGYPFHKYFWMAQKVARSLPDFAGALWNPVHYHEGPSRSLMGRAQHFLDFVMGGASAVARLQNGLPFLEHNGLLGDRLRDLQLPERAAPMSLSAGRRLLGDVLRHEQQTRFVAEFMTKVDGGTMHYALEARSPFLDQKLWEFAAQLPYEVRMQGGTLKAILREIVRRHVGPEVAFRKKQGFTVPVERWLATHWRPALNQLAEDPWLEQQGWLRPGTLRPAVQSSIEAGFVPISLWHSLVLQRWMQRQQLN